MIKTLPLVGYKSLKALNAFSALLIGMKMTPTYMGRGFEEFFYAFGEMDADQKESVIREAVAIVQLEQDEVEALITFALDPNGVPYGPTNLKNLNVKDLHEIIVAVAMEFTKLKVELVTAEEKKKLGISQ